MAASRKRFNAPLCDFGAYADDLTIWVVGHSPKFTAGFAQGMLNIISGWAKRNGIQISTKTEGR